jgi:hypothetical protein
MDEQIVLNVCEIWYELSMDDQAMVHQELPELATALDTLVERCR